MEQSYQEIRKIFQLLDENPDGRVFRGATGYLNEKRDPVMSDAVRDLIERGMSSDEPLYVASIGACTNVASALLAEPRLADHIVVICLAVSRCILTMAMSSIWARKFAGHSICSTAEFPLCGYPA